MTGAEKRQNPEAAASPAVDENPAKKVKVDPLLVDPAVIKKQIEYYMSDDNLAGDKFFHDKIKENAEGFLPVDLILNCNKIKQLRISKAQILDAVKDSDSVDVNAETGCVRRKDNKPLPAFTGVRPGMKARQGKINTNLGTSAGGVVLEVKNIPEALEWGPIKGAVRKQLEALKEHNAEVNGRKLNHCTTKKDGCVQLVVLPFAENLKFFREQLARVSVPESDEEGAKVHELAVSFIYGAAMEAAAKTFPERTRGDLRKATKNYMMKLHKNRRQIKLANMSVDQVQDIKKKVREVLAARGNGEALRVGGSDYNLILAILKFHPTAESKMQNLEGIKVDESAFGGTRCFYVVRKDGTSEDFSVTKALAALEANPPYGDAAAKKESKDAAEAPKAAEEKKEEAKVEAKVEEKKEEAKVEAKVEEKTEEPKEEEKKEEVKA